MFSAVFKGNGCVLQFDREPVETGARHERGGGGAWKREPGADGRFAASKFMSDLV